MHRESFWLQCLRNGTGSERGKGTLFDEVATFHSGSALIENPCAIGGRTLEFAFGLQPICKLSSWKATTLEIDFICAEADVFVTWRLVCRSIFYVKLNRACQKLRSLIP